MMLLNNRSKRQVDTGSQQGNLDFRGTGITLGLGEFSDDGRLVFSGHCHFKLSFIVATQPQFDRASAS